MTKAMQNAIDAGTPEFRAYADYVLESLPDISVPSLREMHRHNASVREWRDHIKQVERSA